MNRITPRSVRCSGGQQVHQGGLCEAQGGNDGLEVLAHHPGLDTHELVAGVGVGTLGVRDHDDVDGDRAPVQHRRDEQVEEHIPQFDQP
jgi:hypothetical protein